MLPTFFSSKNKIDPALKTGSIIGLIMLCGLILRAQGFHSPVDYDEAYTIVEFGTKSWLTAFSDYSLPNNHLFHSVLVKACSFIFGMHTWSVRLPAMAAGLGVILAAFILGKEIFNNDAGILAAVFAAFSPEMIRYSTSARGYSMLDLFVLLSFFTGYRLVTKQSRKLWILLAVFTALGLWTIPLMLYPAGAIYLWLILAGPKSWKYFYSWLASGLIAGLLSLVLYSPALVFSGWRKIFANSFVQPVELKKYYDWILVDRLKETWNSWTMNLPIILIILLTTGFLVSFFITRTDRSPIPLQLIVIVWCTVLIILRRPDMFDRFWSWLVAPVLVWSAGGIINICMKLPPKNMIPKFFIAISLAGLIFFTIAFIPTLPAMWNKISNAEASANYIAAHYQPGDVVLAGYPNNAPVWFYLLQSNVKRETWQARNDAPRYFILLAANQKDQTLSSIIKDYHVDSAVLDTNQPILLTEYGKIKIFAWTK
ncbi:MAG: glycosyltransferase family 39 protein [Chloroflexota bacterium]